MTLPKECGARIIIEEVTWETKVDIYANRNRSYRREMREVSRTTTIGWKGTPWCRLENCRLNKYDQNKPLDTNTTDPEDIARSELYQKLMRYVREHCRILNSKRT